MLTESYKKRLSELAGINEFFPKTDEEDDKTIQEPQDTNIDDLTPQLKALGKQQAFFGGITMKTNDNLFEFYINGMKVGSCGIKKEFEKIFDKHYDVVVLSNFTIQPEFRGKGYSKLLLSKFLEWAKGKGIGTITLNVMKTNIFAYKVYQSFGFKEYDKVSHIENAIKMYLFL